MARRYLWALFIAFAGLGLLELSPRSLLFAQQQELKHPGKVVEMSAANHPVSVDVKAWPESAQTGKGGDCPMFGKAPLDSTQSARKDGQFVLRIQKSMPTYTTTYCATGYYPRVDHAIRNSSDGSPVMPNPVPILPRKVEKTTFQVLVRDKTVALLNDLAYLQSTNPELFGKAVSDFAVYIGKTSAGREKALLSVNDLVRDWRQVGLGGTN